MKIIARTREFTVVPSPCGWLCYIRYVYYVERRNPVRVHIRTIKKRVKTRTSLHAPRYVALHCVS